MLLQNSSQIDLAEQRLKIRAEAVEDGDEVFVFFGDKDFFDEAFDRFGVFVI